MAQRYSLIQNKLSSVLSDTYDKTTMLWMDDAAIDYELLVDLAAGELIRAYDGLQKSVRADLVDRFVPQTVKSVVVIVPLPLKTATIWGEPDFDSPIPTFSKWRDLITKHGKDDTVPPYVHGVGFTIDVPKEVPLTRYYSPVFLSRCMSHRDGILLTPEVLGSHNDGLIKKMTHMYNNMMVLEFMNKFANVVARTCTTPGIAKAVWPEIVSVLGKSASLQASVASAKPSQFPPSFTRLFSGSQEDGWMSLDQIRAQLAEVTNVILASKLMPDPDSYVTPAVAHVGEPPRVVVINKNLTGAFK